MSPYLNWEFPSIPLLAAPLGNRHSTLEKSAIGVHNEYEYSIFVLFTLLTPPVYSIYSYLELFVKALLAPNERVCLPPI